MSGEGSAADAAEGDRGGRDIQFSRGGGGGTQGGAGEVLCDTAYEERDVG